MDENLTTESDLVAEDFVITGDLKIESSKVLFETLKILDFGLDLGYKTDEPEEDKVLR